MLLSSASGTDPHSGGASDSPSHARRGPTERYAIDLLFATEPSTGDSEIEAALRSALARYADGAMELGDAVDPGREIRLVAAAPPPDGGATPSWSLSPGPLNAEARAALETALTQSWWWAESGPTVQRAAHRIVLSDHHQVGLDYRRRLAEFQRAAVVAIDALEPIALHWRPSDQLLEPASFLRSVVADDFTNPLPGGFNVRFFRIEPEGDEPDDSFLMDTAGLGALGLLELQCHFRGLDPEEVSRVLYSTATYLFQRGPVIQPGSTVQGPRPDDVWQVALGPSLAAPERQVLDLDPGHPFSASA